MKKDTGFFILPEDGEVQVGFKNNYLLISLTGILCTVLLVFSDLFFNGGTLILTSGITDTATQFVYFREFAFSELKKGNLPLWNPYLFSGAPYLGGFQAALFYPLNAIYLFLPLAYAINVSIVLHVMLLGFFMFLWAERSGLRWHTAFLSAILLMFSGAHFPHIFAGHLPNLCAMAWVPLIFLCLDELIKKYTLRWVLIGIASVSMQILAGHPQYVYYTVIVSLLYVVLKIFWGVVDGRRLANSVVAIVFMFFGGALLCAVQILTGIEASGESVRAGGVPYHFAAMFSLPPENLLTLFIPNIFGDLTFHPYWGRLYYWESNLFIGIGGFTLALYACFRGGRREHLIGILILFCIILSLGARTPLFDVLYRYLPGFNQFRGTAKFAFFVNVFLSFLAGAGLHLLVQQVEDRPTRRVVLSLLGGAVLASILSGILYLVSVNETLLNCWRDFLHFIAESGESFLPKDIYYQKRFSLITSSLSAFQVLLSAFVFLFTALAWHVYLKRKGHFFYLIVLLAAVEVLVVAGMTRTSFDIEESRPIGLVKFLSQVDRDARVLNLWRPNIALFTRVGDIWGYDPGVGRRYAEFITFTQGGDPRFASQYVNFNRYHPLLKLTRLKYILVPTEKGLAVHEIKDIMSPVSLVYNWQWVVEKEKILEEMAKDDFDPRQQVILEKNPLLERPGSCPSPGQVKIKSLDTDTMIVEAESECPGVILITDNYAKGWRAESLLPGQNRYEILRADYTFMAIPVNKGKHKIRLEYLPQGYKIGCWVSLGAFLLYLALWVYAVKFRCQRQ
ncbi:MAG: YfhO family protein [Syntrophales bacterium]|nr:YfhO family protein [Syntrophales bacterium]